MRRRFVCGLTLLGWLLSSCASTWKGPPADTGLVELATCLSGAFSSAAQAARGGEFRDVRLHMVQVWPERRDGIWLYVEQAMAATLDAPYRQRVYRLSHVGGDLYESRVFELPDPAAVAGAWHDTGKVALLRAETLVPRRGCEILLRRGPDGTFSGSTLGRLCPSAHRGATFATSEVVITPTRFVSWDRGFDGGGRQVWGAETGPYEFDKLKSYPIVAPTASR